MPAIFRSRSRFGGKLPSEVDLQRVAEYAAELLWRFEREYGKRPRE